MLVAQVSQACVSPAEVATTALLLLMRLRSVLVVVVVVPPRALLLTMPWLVYFCPALSNLPRRALSYQSIPVQRRPVVSL
jgi:hypothetical protein